MKRVRILAFLVAMVMTLGLAACSQPASQTNATQAPEATKAPTEAPKTEDTGTKTEATEAPAADEPLVDLSQQVELIVYFVGDPYPSQNEIVAKLNEKLMADFNCTMKINFTTWADYATKYNLILTSGQPVDMIYTANWLTDRDYAKKHAFKPLDELVPKYAPKLWSFVEKPYWEDATEDGSIYTIPATWKEYIDAGVLYREDLRKKYNLPEPTTLEGLEAYLAGIKANETGILPTLESGATGSSYSGFTGTDVRSMTYFDRGVTDCGLIIGYSADGKNSSIRDVKPYWGTDLHISDLQVMKRFADGGFWSRNALSQKVDNVMDSFKAGQGAAVLSGLNVQKFAGAVEDAEKNHPDWEIGYFSYKGLFGCAQPVQPTQNGTAFPVTGKNTERALMVLEKLMFDKDYYMLTHYGIEGADQHYTVDANNTYIPGAKSNDFPSDGMNNWNWRNPEFMVFPKSYEMIAQLNKEFEKREQIFPIPFAPNVDNVQTEIAAIGQLRNQYLAPISAGLSKDIEKDLANFMEKAKAAGLEKVQKNYIDQYLQWCDTRGY